MPSAASTTSLPVSWSVRGLRRQAAASGSWSSKSTAPSKCGGPSVVSNTRTWRGRAPRICWSTGSVTSWPTRTSSLSPPGWWWSKTLRGGVQWDDKRPACTRTRGASSSSLIFVLCAGKLSIPLKKSSVQCWLIRANLSMTWPLNQKKIVYGIVPSPTWKNYDFSEKVLRLSTLKMSFSKDLFKVLYSSS